jgi:hypothetical protein
MLTHQAESIGFTIWIVLSFLVFFKTNRSAIDYMFKNDKIGSYDRIKSEVTRLELIQILLNRSNQKVNSYESILLSGYIDQIIVGTDQTQAKYLLTSSDKESNNPGNSTNRSGPTGKSYKSVNKIYAIQEEVV